MYQRSLVVATATVSLTLLDRCIERGSTRQLWLGITQIWSNTAYNPGPGVNLAPLIGRMSVNRTLGKEVAIFGYVSTLFP